MFSFSPKHPKVIRLRGDAPRDIREIPEDLLPRLAPAPIRLSAPLEINLEVLAWLWWERGYHIPTILSETADCFSLTVLTESETFHNLGHPFFSPAEIIQLELSKTIVATIPKFLNRDYVQTQAQQAGVELDPRLLSRLSKYLRKLLQAGWTLPPPQHWSELASSVPFDELGRGWEAVQLRSPLPGSQRTQLIFQALTEETGTPETLQAIEEFWTASGQLFPVFSQDPQVLIRDLLRNPRLELEAWARKTPDFEEQILQSENLPAPTLARLTRLALNALPGQEFDWPLPQLLATPAQERMARQRPGP